MEVATRGFGPVEVAEACVVQVEGAFELLEIAETDCVAEGGLTEAAEFGGRAWRDAGAGSGSAAAGATYRTGSMMPGIGAISVPSSFSIRLRLIRSSSFEASAEPARYFQ